MSLKHFFKISFWVICLFANMFCNAQDPEKVYKSNIATAQFFEFGNQSKIPIYNLTGGTRFQLQFDDLDADYKNYYYMYVLCDYNWKPVQNVTAFDYMKGFTQNRINTYRYSSISLKRYTHYQAVLPEQNSVPTKSGNYILKIYTDGDTANLVFTKRLLVVEAKASVNASVNQLLGALNFNTHQKVRFTVTTGDLNAFSAAQQIKVVVLQNNRWDIAQRDIVPTFVRGSVLDYSNENIAQFAAGKEWRWCDLQSFRIQSDRVDHADYGKLFTNMYMATDLDRSEQRYVYFPDYNGSFSIRTFENINPAWQADYATVKFTLVPPEGKPYSKKEVYLAGQFTNYELDEKYKMHYNDSTGLYEVSTFMKQGYYSYTYSLVGEKGLDKTNPLEGNYWETENNYTILVYYKSFTDRVDQLIGVGQVNSRRDRPGLSF